MSPDGYINTFWPVTIVHVALHTRCLMVLFLVYKCGARCHNNYSTSTCTHHLQLHLYFNPHSWKQSDFLRQSPLCTYVHAGSPIHLGDGISWHSWAKMLSHPYNALETKRQLNTPDIFSSLCSLSHYLNSTWASLPPYCGNYWYNYWYLTREMQNGFNF